MGRTQWQSDLTSQSPLGLQQRATVADAALAVFLDIYTQRLRW